MKQNRLFIIAVAAILIICSVFSAIVLTSPDGYKYTGDEIYKGVYYKEEKVTLSDGKNANTYILTISSSNKDLTVAAGVPDDTTPLEPGFVQTTSNQAISAEINGKYVIAAVNADYFYMDNLDMIQPCSITIKDGELLTEFKTTRWDRDCFFGIKKDGTPIIGNENVYKEVKNELYQAVGAGPWLIADGSPNTYEESKERHPRTAVGILKNGSVIFVVVDGRSDESAGFSYKELAEYMHSLGCIQAVNLDGGGSTTLVVKDFEYEYLEIRNEYSDKYERPVGNTLLVIDKSKKPMTD